MKRWIPIVLCILLLAGCSDSDAAISRAMNLRSRLLSSGCSFDAQVTADYGDRTHSFLLQCSADPEGNLLFTVLEPESIRDISGKLSSTGGQLTFDENAVSFSLLADGEISPISSVWILVNTLRGGYLRSCGSSEAGLRVTIDDSYEEDALQLDIWLDEEDLPQYGEILWQGRRILSLKVSNFRFL